MTVDVHPDRLEPEGGWEQPVPEDKPGMIGLQVDGRPPSWGWMRMRAEPGDELAERRIVEAAQRWSAHLLGFGLLMGEGRIRRTDGWVVIDAPLELIP